MHRVFSLLIVFSAIMLAGVASAQVAIPGSGGYGAVPWPAAPVVSVSAPELNASQVAFMTTSNSPVGATNATGNNIAGATNATGNNIAGATNATLSNVPGIGNAYTSAPLYVNGTGASFLDSTQLESGTGATAAEQPGIPAPTRETGYPALGVMQTESAYNAPSGALVLAARDSREIRQNAGNIRTYTNSDVEHAARQSGVTKPPGHNIH